MASINQVTLLGRVGQEPKVNTSASGVTVAKLSIATSRKYKDKEETQWHNVVVFNKAAEFAQKYIHKGDQVIAIGEIKYDKYTNDKGEEKFLTNIVASNIQLCSSVSKQDNGGHAAQSNDLPDFLEF